MATDDPARPGKPLSVTVGDASCPYCGHAIQVKATKKGFLGFACAPVEDGGCHHQQFSRSDASDRHMAKLVKKWRKAEYKTVYLGKAAPAPEPDDEPDDELPPDEPAAPAPRRAVPPKPAKRTPAPSDDGDATMKELFG